MLQAVTRPSFGAATGSAPSGNASAGSDAGDVIESLLGDEDVKKALDGFKKRITEKDPEASETGEKGEKAEKKTFFQAIKPWLSLLGTLAVAVLGVIFGKRGGVMVKP